MFTKKGNKKLFLAFILVLFFTFILVMSQAKKSIKNLPAEVEERPEGILRLRANAGPDITTSLNVPVLFKGEASSLDNNILMYEWDFDGDGVFDSSSDKPVALHTYTEEGVYDAVFKITDINGFSDFDVVKVSVGEEGYQKEGAGGLFQPLLGEGDGVRDRYIVMINGASEDRFWVDVYQFYSTLTGVYNYTPDEIYLLNYNGQNPYGQNPNNMIDYSATKENLTLVFNELATIVDGDDILFVWITDHGDGYYGQDCFYPEYYGYLGSEASVEPGDEEDYLESDFELRALFTGGNYPQNHGMGVWKLESQYMSPGVNRYYRVKYLSSFSNIELEDSSFVSDSDIFVEKFTDYLEGDFNKNGYIETSLGEVLDYDDDGNPPYDGLTDEFDEDDWGLPDTYEDNFFYLSTQVPGGDYCLFDDGLDNTLDIDIDCLCLPYDLAHCNINLLDVDGTDLDNAGLFDGLDVNDDGDMDDWVSIDEIISLYGNVLSDDELKTYVNSLSMGRNVVFMQPCFSGGFVEDLSADNTVIMTATVEEDLAWGNDFIRAINLVLANVTVGDANSDGIVSMVEVFNYAAENAHYDDSPQYDDNGDGISQFYPIPAGGDGNLGALLFLNKGDSGACGDGYCDGEVENCGICPLDCTSGYFAICGDGVCHGSLLGETCSSCSADCVGGSIGGTCEACFKGVCDGDCNTRKEDSTCADCNPPVNYCCGDYVCEGEENVLNCPVDCNTPPEPNAYCCGDSVCEGEENEIVCQYDCGCQTSEDCDDDNECTTDICNAGVCENNPVSDNSLCSLGICCSGQCAPASCSNDGDCDDSETCTLDVCIAPGTCSSSCTNTWPDCGIADGCCGPSCGAEDEDCVLDCSTCFKGVCDGNCNPNKDGPDCPDCF